MKQIIPYALCCGWSLLFGMAFALYFARIRNMPFYCLLPDDYHTYDVEQKKKFWNQDEAWRKHKIARAIMFAPLLYIGGVLVVMFLASIRVTPANASQEDTGAPQATATTVVEATPTQAPTAAPTPTLSVIQMNTIEQDGQIIFVEATP